MGLSLGVGKGDKISIAEHCLEVRAIKPAPDRSAADLITIAMDGGEDTVISDHSKIEILTGVFAFSGIGANGNTSRLVFEAPPSILIRRSSL